MKHERKLSQEQQHIQQAAEQQNQRQAAREFGSAEEMLRFDAQQTNVPPEIATRLKRNANGTATGPATAPRSWWKNLFGR